MTTSPSTAAIPTRILVMGHSAGAQLAALICTDDRYLKAEGLSLAIDQGLRARGWRHLRRAGHHRDGRDASRVHGMPLPKFGHRQKFGNDPEKHRDFSAVTHVARARAFRRS